MEKNIFEGAKFGDKYKTRNGNTAVYLSTEVHETFTIVHCAIEHNVHYEDGTEKRFHDVNMYDIRGNFNRFDVDTEYPYDIVSKWSELVNEECFDKMAIEDVKKITLLEPKVIAYYRGYKDGYRKVLNK